MANTLREVRARHSRSRQQSRQLTRRLPIRIHAPPRLSRDGGWRDCCFADRRRRVREALDEGDDAVTLTLRPHDVAAVLLPDGWHDVRPGTFTVDADGMTFRVVPNDDYGDVLHGDGAAVRFLEPPHNFVVLAPLESVRAVRGTPSQPTSTVAPHTRSGNARP